jgi:hypothetical protein
MRRSPLPARTGPPLTGASTVRMPFSVRRAAVARAASGPTVLVRMTVVREEGAFYLGLVSDCEEDDVGVLGGFCGGGDGSAARLGDQGSAVFGCVVGRDREVGGQAGGHGEAHGAQADHCRVGSG